MIWKTLWRGDYNSNKKDGMAVCVSMLNGAAKEVGVEAIGQCYCLKKMRMME